MNKRLVTPQMVELRNAIMEAETLTGRAELSKRDESRVNFLMAKIATLRTQALAPTGKRSPETLRFFRDLLTGREPEQRATAAVAGQQSITYTDGSAGGYLVPQEFHDEVLVGMAQYDPLLDEDIVNLIESKDASLRPYRIPGWDLSTFSAAKIGESAQQTAQTLPVVASAKLGSYTYRCNIPASFEFEEDEFESTIDTWELAFAIGLARGIGKDLATGNGTTAPQGVLTGAVDSGITTGAANVIALDDIENIYFSVDRFYRAQEKCAWVVADETYQLIRKARDTANRPLLSVKDDKEVLMGKPVYVSPTIPHTVGTQGIVFGDLNYFAVRLGQPVIKRSLQAPGYVENGLALYTAFQRVDSIVFDPTGGSKSPIKFATLHA